MFELNEKRVLVIGLGGRGRAACELLCRHGASVVAIDAGDSPDLRQTAGSLRALGVEAVLDAKEIPGPAFSLVVLSPAVPLDTPLVQAALQSGVPVISELELGFHQAKCFSIAIA